jgi:hypothetical protein
MRASAAIASMPYAQKLNLTNIFPILSGKFRYKSVSTSKYAKKEIMADCKLCLLLRRQVLR